ncbi:MAG: phosphoglycerate mutase family protein [Chloroflexota bacterium]|nr:phosphoglycerate mutase family protein [Chloroflexota bacterium]
MPNTLILIRHSQSQPEPGRPASQWPLTEAGQQRCIALAERLVAYAPDLIVTSRERKASATGALVAARLALPTKMADGLHEHQREHAGWLPEPAFEQAVSAFFARPNELVFGEETASQASARFDAAVRDILAAHPRQTVALVSHGTVITLFVAQHAGVAALPFWKCLGMPAIMVMSLPEMGLLEVIERT